MKRSCKPICIQWIGKALKKGSWALKLKYNVNTHTMRKTWGYHAYERGEDILYIQALLNHANQHTTLRYIGVTKSAIQKMYHTNALEIA
jgi:site-specific recombinase XerD